jgi:hypothetical protein
MAGCFGHVVNGRSVADALQAVVESVGADLIVMGGFGHRIDAGHSQYGSSIEPIFANERDQRVREAC